MQQTTIAGRVSRNTGKHIKMLHIYKKKKRKKVKNKKYPIVSNKNLFFFSCKNRCKISNHNIHSDSIFDVTLYTYVHTYVPNLPLQSLKQDTELTFHMTDVLFFI